MTRSSTAESNTYFPNYKNQNKIANICLTTSIFAVIVLIIAAIIIITTNQETSEDLIAKVIHSDGGSENVAIEDREIFEGFRTSFLPPKEVMLARRQLSGHYREVDKLSSYEKDYDGQNDDYAQRFKRMAQFMFASEDYDSPTGNSRGDEVYNEDSLYKTDIENENEESEPDGKSNAFEAPTGDEKSAALPGIHHLDKLPLDDVVEQVRGQPELEEAEIGSPAVLYKPTKSDSTFHAFWKGQGDRRTIRKTQADIMKKYMDPSVDPCEDFYQYACGNWAELNPIPADKAGYDTFEMLRENLDSVLRDILEFKKLDLKTVYPGSHLDNQFSKVDTVKRNNNGQTLTISDLKTVLVPEVETDIEKFGIINRIRRYLDKKLKPKKTIKANKGNQTHVVRKHVIMPKTKRQKLLQKIAHQKQKSRKTSKTYSGKMKNHYKKRQLLSFSKKGNNKIKRETKKLEQYYYLGKNDPAQGSAVLKARYLFKSCMNHDILQKRGQQPLLDLIEKLGGWPILDRFWVEKRFDWVELMAQLRLYNNDILISEWVGPDIKNSDEFVIQFDQTTLGLPTRDYFLLDSNMVYLEGYKNYLIKIAVLLGGDHLHVMKSAEDLISFEKKLASITSSPEERRNVSDIYRRMSLKDLEFIIPEVKWKKYLTIVMDRKVDSNETIVIFAVNYVKLLVKLIEETPPNTLRNYLLWRFVRHRVNNLDDRFQSAKQQFYHILFGREQAPPRWKNCVAQVNSNMGMALGAMFVQKYFDEMSKNDTLTMTKELQQSFIELLHLTDWIDDETKSLAERKVDSMILRIGYPDYILDENELNGRYQEVLIHPDMYFENILNILQHLTKLEQSRLGQPVDKSLWNSAPAVVNAYYSRNKNQIMFPAGILQPPFYHRHFPRSLNYGGIGVVIGHEITHGFDDKGRLFDSEGNLHRWWSDSAIRAFHKRAQCLIDQYGEYVIPEVKFKLDGVNTQGENIADNGGVKQAFRAYVNWLHKHGTEGETLPGLNHTHTQLFFLNFAQVWCGAMRPEAMRSKLKTAVHSPGRFRVIGSLSNSMDFAREFDCPLGSPMNPKDKCSVW